MQPGKYKCKKCGCETAYLTDETQFGVSPHNYYSVRCTACNHFESEFRWFQLEGRILEDKRSWTQH